MVHYTSLSHAIADSQLSILFVLLRRAITSPRRVRNWQRFSQTFRHPSHERLAPARSLDECPSMPPVLAKNDAACIQQYQHNMGTPSSLYDGSIAKLSSSFGGLSMLEQQGRDPNRSSDATSLRMTSILNDPRQPTPLLIPMQPTGAGVPLTSVVETLSSKGSKAAAEDPETVAAAYKLSQWGIG